jgi:hypothetical protein
MTHLNREVVYNTEKKTMIMMTARTNVQHDNDIFAFLKCMYKCENCF